ncbi:hypothetical protein [Dactylosporangium salmoneum]|uniref:Uncharacterized protein n=1 Tax=Dactylosporangium salmoneum TaxID=53361 RepID=A0ABN3G4H4_9ACTN
MTETEIRRIRFLDLLYDFERSNPGQVPGIVALLGELYSSQDDGVWRGILRMLDRQGLIKFIETNGLKASGATITGSGSEAVEARRERRLDPVGRNAAARNAIVRWLYSQPGYEADDLGPMMVDPISLYEAVPLSLDDLEAALIYLKRKGLIDGVTYAEREWVAQPVLTDKGVDCAEHFKGSVADYVRHNEGRGASTHNISIHGNVSGNLAWASEAVTQTATTTTEGLAGDELAALVKALKEASSVFQLDETDQANLARDLDVVEGELVRDQPNADVVKTFMQRALETVEKAVGSTLSVVMTAYAKHLLQQAGIPID